MPCGCHGCDRGHGPLLRCYERLVGAPLCPVGAMGAIAGMARSYGAMKDLLERPIGAIALTTATCAREISAHIWYLVRHDIQH